MNVSAARFALFCCLFLAARGFAQSPAAAPDSRPRPLQLPGIENAFQATSRVYSGGQPEGDEAFAALQKLGIRTLISVDGTKPDVERAARFGLRYVHLPHGYDGISSNTAVRLAKAAVTVEGPIFVHCHHGKHRGPAAVGVICQATAGWTTNDAVAFMKQAGTAADYAGLYRANTGFRVPTLADLARVPADFPARVEISGLVDAMVELDYRWDHLKAIQAAGWRVPPNQPDLVPADEAKLLAEAYRELQRRPEAQARGAEFLTTLRTAETRADALHAQLKSAGDFPGGAALPQLETQFREAGQSCTACHRQFRN